MGSTASKIKKFFTANNAKEGESKETVKTIVLALLFALIFRSFVFEPFHIPSGSMKSNLLIGDYLFVSKFSYGYSRFSLPFFFKLMPFHDRVFFTPPKRGDIVVFHPPGLPPMGDVYIKRLMGLPGDRIQVKEGVVYINDKPLKKEYVDDWVDKDSSGDATTLVRSRETNPEGKSYLVLNEKIMGEMENTSVYTVPEKHYFMMGDNRDHSADSRYPVPPGVVSYVPEEDIVGRADMIFFSWACTPICTDRLLVKLP